MGQYLIQGGRKLSGEIAIGGAKNAVLPILAATLVNKGISVIHNCPIISDTLTSIEILKSLGCNVKTEGTTIIVDSTTLVSKQIPEDFVKKMRSSILFLGSLMTRFNDVEISYPGGCDSLW